VRVVGCEDRDDLRVGDAGQRRAERLTAGDVPEADGSVRVPGGELAAVPGERRPDRPAAGNDGVRCSGSRCSSCSPERPERAEASARSSVAFLQEMGTTNQGSTAAAMLAVALVQQGRPTKPSATPTSPRLGPRLTTPLSAAVANRRYDVTGPQALSADDVMEIVGHAYSKRVDVVHVTPRQLEEHLATSDANPDFVPILVAVAVAVKEGRFDGPTDAVKELSGRDPQTLRDFVLAHKTATRPRGP
jgi:hypothetical protein